MNKGISVFGLAAQTNGKVVGDGDAIIYRTADLAAAEAGDIAFVEDVKLFEKAVLTRASCLITSFDAEIDFPPTILRVKQPKLAFAEIAAALNPPIYRAGIHASAEIAASAVVNADVFIGANVSIGENTIIAAQTQIFSGVSIGANVSIGERCVIHPNAVLYDNVKLGDAVILHAGTIIGADGFGYVRGENGYVKFPQIGTVEIGNDVEIGAHSCVDRGALGATRIGSGTKIDNLVQIGHNVSIGERVIIAAQTGVSGSTVIESDAVIGGQVGMGDHARILSGAVIGSKAGILPGKIVRAGVWWGVPVQPLEDYKRQNALVRALPRMRDEVRELQKRLTALEAEIAAAKQGE